MKDKIKKGSVVSVLTGDHKKKSGTVIAISGDMVWIENINIVKKHFKHPTDKDYSIIADKTMPIHISNLKLQK
jgi:large subunit ribosomal protein L24